MADLETRLRRARQHLEPAWSDAREQRVADGLERRRRRRRALRTGAAALLLLGIVAIASWQQRAATTTPALPVLTLADDSSVELADPHQLVRQLDTRAQVRLELKHGRASFVVTHDPKRPFRVEAGPVAVEVLGTRFDVDRGATSTSVRVHEGRVAVFTARGRTELTAGQRGDYPVEVAHDPQPASRDPQPATRDPQPVARDPQAVPRDAPPAPRPTESAAQLLELADRARESGRPADAVAPLRRLLDVHPRDSRAPLAAFTLGRVLLDSLHRPAEAAEAFARAQSPVSALHEDALAREVDAAARAGNLARARARALAYVARYPEGPHLALVRRQGKLE